MRRRSIPPFAQDGWKAARIGVGRNVLLCEAFVDDWLKASVRERKPHDNDTVAMLRPRDVA